MLFCGGSLTRLIQTFKKLLIHIDNYFSEVLPTYATVAVYKDPHCSVPSPLHSKQCLKLYSFKICLSILLKFFEAHVFKVLFHPNRFTIHGIVPWTYHYILKFPVLVTFHRGKNIHSGIPKQSKHIGEYFKTFHHFIISIFIFMEWEN